MSHHFRPIHRQDGYLPIGDHGLLGDGSGAALGGRDGTVSWLCAPRFDSSPVFAGLLDQRRGGAFQLNVVAVRESRQYYEQDSAVLVTELRTDTGELVVTDAMTLADDADLRTWASSGRGELLRLVRVRHGHVRLAPHVDPRGDVQVEETGHGWRLRCRSWPELVLHYATAPPLRGVRSDEITMHAGDQVWAQLSWVGPAHQRSWRPPEQRLAETSRIWREWASQIDYDGPQSPLVRRSAITLKMLDYTANGAIVAAPTSSLPEGIGGERNWDYRYTWVRDAAFSVYAMRRLKLDTDADGFLRWVLEAVDRHGEPRVMYTLQGHEPPSEWVDAELSGYRNSHPVRWGNDAARQTQHDVYGEILDCAYQWVTSGRDIEPALWDWLAELAELARRRWRQPDHGMWEVRTAGRNYTYSVATCQVALDRAARMAQRLDLPGDWRGWAAEAQTIRRALLDQAWDPEQGAITEYLGHHDGRPGGLDASVVALPLRRVLDSNHPRMRATTEAVATQLSAGNGLLYRYLPDRSPDGLEGEEGAFLLCSFWLVDNLARQGRLDEAGQLYESLCGRANALGLLPEQIDPATGAFLGNFPQAFSHVGVIASGLNLQRFSQAGNGKEHG